ncbi:MAG: hypothetical protein H6648_06445 [Caldilineae bacterium]|nr:hypothetical protein [Chloroflexota bacterium]MCB9176784.1 hypothetical protein [Caldilineae bacterium]
MNRLNPIENPIARRLVLGLGLAFALGVLAAMPRPALAQRAKIVPAGTAWCGVTDAGGSVHFELSSDLRFVEWIEINQPPPKDVTISTQEGQYGGTTRAQIADDMFIFRKDRQETECRTQRPGPNPPPSGRCNTAPCRPSRCTTPGCRGGGEVCETKDVNEMMIRGSFKSPESLSGVFSAIVQDGTDTRGRAPVRIDRRIGSFIAWPQGAAPCP